MTTVEHQYVATYRVVVRAVNDCTQYVTASLRQQVDALEARIGDSGRIEALRERARSDV